MAEGGGSPPDGFDKLMNIADEKLGIDQKIVQQATVSIEQQNLVSAAEREIAELKNKLALKKLADERAKLMEQLGASEKPKAVPMVKEEKPKARGRPKKEKRAVSEVCGLKKYISLNC